jgi:hypothetical protein
VVIVNPNSPGTDDIVAKKWQKLEPERVNYIFHDEREWYGASWLRAWRHAKGQFVANSNTDDLHYPEYTRVMYDKFSEALKSVKFHRGMLRTEKPDIAFAYAGIHVINEKGQTVTGGIKPPFDFDLFTRECWGGPQVLWRNDDDFKGFLNWDLMDQRASEHRSAFDYWLWLYFMSLGFHGLSIQQILTVYTQRPDSIENSNKWVNNYEAYSSISEFFPDNFESHLTHAVEFAIFGKRPQKDAWVESKLKG